MVEVSVGRRVRRAAVVVVGAAAVGVVLVGIGLAVGATDTGGVATSLREAATEHPLRAPWQPSRDEQFPSATECASCHPTQVGQWRASTHSTAARNPLVHASPCGRCHAPLGTQFDDEYQLKLYDRKDMPHVPAAAAEGVTCVACHAPREIPEDQTLTFITVWPNWRSTGLALRILPFEAAVGGYGSGATDDPAPVANDSHPSLADPSMRESDVCRPCHDVTVDKGPFAPHCGPGQTQVRLLTTYAEWEASPYPAKGQTCQSCHMPYDLGWGPSAVAPPGTTYDRSLPDRQLANHTMTGLSSDYLGSGVAVLQQESRVEAHVRGAASMTLTVPATVTVGGRLPVIVTATNTGAGHDLPTGFAFWSESWLEVTATDAAGRTLLRSGDVDAEGWLRDEFNPRVIGGSLPYDAYLVSLRSRLVSLGPNRASWAEEDGSVALPPEAVPRNRNGTPIIGVNHEVATRILRSVYPEGPPPSAGVALQEGYVLRFADTVLRGGIPALASRRAEFPVPLDGPVTGPVRVTARLLIRSQWPWMLQQQLELPTPRPRPRVYEIATDEASVPVRTP